MTVAEVLAYDFFRFVSWFQWQRLNGLYNPFSETTPFIGEYDFLADFLGAAIAVGFQQHEPRHIVVGTHMHQTAPWVLHATDVGGSARCVHVQGAPGELR